MQLTTIDRNILHLLATGERGSAPIADALGESRRTVQDHLAGLRERGLVEQRTRGSWTLTGAGKRAALASSVPEPTASIASLDTLPAEHRAMLRLIEAAVIARRALRDVYPSNWPAFILLGPTKSGKTLLGTLAARRFGLDPIAACRLLMRETPGSLLGRRVQTGSASWEMTPSPLLSLPLVMFDEFDKASPEQRGAVFAYLEGVSRYQSEDGELDIQATVIVTLNAERDLGLLPDAYLRRSVVLDTAPLALVVRDLDLVAAALARVVLPVVSPDLTPPAADLSADARRGLRTLLQNCLTERGWQLVDVEAVSRLVLGRWATLPTDLVAAVVSTAADYLLVTSTRAGFVVDDWPLVFEQTVGPAAAAAAGMLAAARARLAVQAGQQAAMAGASLGASLELAGTRERLLGMLDDAVRSIPRLADLTAEEPAIRDTAVGKARLLRVTITAARSPAAFATPEALLGPEVITPIRMVVTARENRRREAADAIQRTKERDKAARLAASAAVQADKKRRAGIQALCRRSTTRPGEAVLDALVAAGCLTRESEQYEAETFGSQGRRFFHRLHGTVRATAAALAPAGSGIVAIVTPEPVPVCEPKIRTWYEDRAGHRYRATELLAWGSPAVDAVLGTALAAEGLPPLTRPAPRRASPRRA
ncbi:MAG: ArsR family transcriptional regulator [Chloroflexi bacterium]|nr:ArsR family transcriptional regulator [Chloroflexota bacterium]